MDHKTVRESEVVKFRVLLEPVLSGFSLKKHINNKN